MGVDMCLISCGRPLSVVGGKLIWMPWLGKMPAASTSDGVGDRRGVSAAVRSSAMAGAQTTSQHWADRRMQESRARARGAPIGLYAIWQDWSRGPGDGNVSPTKSCRASSACACVLPSADKAEWGWQLDSNQTAVRLQPITCTSARHLVLPVNIRHYCATVLLHSKSKARRAAEIVVVVFAKALGLAEPLSAQQAYVEACLSRTQHVRLLLLHIRPPQ